MRKENISSSAKLAGVAVVFTLIFFWSAIADTAMYFTTNSEQTITVCSKEAVPQRMGHKYMIYTNEDTYVLRDFLILVGPYRFDTADVYGRIEPGKQYRIKSFGLRFGPFSWFKNVENLELVEGGGENIGC